MKYIIRTSTLKLLLFSIFFIHSCKKEEIAVTPTITTVDVSEITYLTAVSGGNIIEDGGTPLTFQGICWSTSENPTTSDQKVIQNGQIGAFTAKLENLFPETKYYVRAFAINDVGIAYGNQISFSTTLLTDVEGNTYKSIKIGNQFWMAENLKSTKYNDGKQIALIEDKAVWSIVQIIGYCWYNNEIKNKATYGALYNWNAVNTGKLCPIGWRVPNFNDWDKLEIFLGGESVAGGKLKEIGLTHWVSPNTGATNESGFTALPGGGRNPVGEFYKLGVVGGYWTSSIELVDSIPESV